MSIIVIYKYIHTQFSATKVTYFGSGTTEMCLCVEWTGVYI